MAAVDAAEVYAYRHLPEVRRFQSFEPRSLADVERYIADMRSDVFGDPGPWCQFAIRLRVGMRKEAHFRESLWFKGEWVDDVIYAVLASEMRE